MASLHNGSSLPARHSPLLHLSLRVHGLSSSQLKVLFLCMHPDMGLQLSEVHGLLSSQSRAVVPGRQTPLSQASPIVHILPSSQAPTTMLCTHPSSTTHLSSVQGLPSLHSSNLPWQVPDSQMSLPVQGFPSSHCALLFTKLQPPAGRQISSVHGLSS